MDTNVWNNLNKGQQLAAGGGLAAIIASFLPWYVLKDEFIASVSAKGTDFTFGWMGAVLLVAAAGLVIAPAFDKEVGTDQIRGEQIAIIAAGLGALLWLIRLVQVPAIFFGSMGRGFGLFVAAAAAATVVAGVVMTMKEKNIAMPTMDNFKSAEATTAPAAPAAPVAPVTHPAPAPQQYAAPTPAPAPAPPAPQQYVAPTPAPAPAPQQYQAPAPAPQAPTHTEF